MANAQLAEEELQQSVVVSEEDVDEGPLALNHPETRAQSVLDAQRTRSSLEAPDETDDTESRGFLGLIDQDRSGALDEMLQHREVDEEDAEGELDDTNVQEEERHLFNIEAGVANARLAADWSRGRSCSHGSKSSVATSSGTEDEGVGAVKIKPGETDEDEEDEEDEESNASASEASSPSGLSNDSDEDAAWEDAQEEGRDEEADEDSEANPPGLCVFCKQDEEHDPGDEFEEVLTCLGCGEISHRDCARQAGIPPDAADAEDWNCLDCVTEDRPSSAVVATNLEAEPSQPAAHAPPIDVDGSDQTDASRSLRKRKTSPLDHDGISMSLRKRTRKASGEPTHSVEATDLQSDAADDIQPRKSRLKLTRQRNLATVTSGPQIMLIKFHVSPSRLRDVLSHQPSNNSKRGARRDATRPSRAGNGLTTAPFVPSAAHPFYSFLDRETDGSKDRPYGGILNNAEADTSKTLPASDDRKRFDEAKQQAEAEWRNLHATQLSGEKAEHRKKTKKPNGPASQIECIEFGGWEIDTWYAAPYPEEYSRNRILYICEFCLKYMNSDYVAWRHKLKCPAKHPPGDEIYRHGSVSVFEVDGRKNPVYCQNLCLLAKLFLGSKTLYYDVEPFLFYVLCEYDDLGYHFVGYFSKEKRASSQNNVSCILTLPIHQRKGYGNLLIDFSYLLTRVEQKTGSPEKPLSDMGLVSYRNYWRLVLCRYLLDQWQHALGRQPACGLSVRHISDETGLTPDDVISALEGLRCLARDPGTGLYAFRIDLTYCRDYLSKWEAKGYVGLNPAALTWTPYVMGRGIATNFELGPAITAIAPREEDEDRKVKVSPRLPAVGASKLEGDTPSDALDPRSAGLRDLGPVDVSSGFSASVDATTAVVRQSTEPKDVMNQDIGLAEASNDSRGSQVVEVTHTDWLSQYDGIAPSRFEVYPTHTGRRTERPRNPAPRATVLRTSSNSVRPRRPMGSTVSVNRPTPSRPKPGNSSRRKTGGTGRGPGRWPKGTKKSDYGNASSGPGLPPGWVKEREKPPGLKAQDDEHSGEAAESAIEAVDTVRVQVGQQGDVDREGQGGSQIRIP